MTSLGVVVPAYNRGQNLALMLASLEVQSYQAFHVVIADDGSTDGSREFIESVRLKPAWNGRLTWVGCSRGRGGRRARARNIGAANLPSGIDQVLFLDSDIVLHPSSVEAHALLLQMHRPVTVFGRFDWLPPLEHDFVRKCLEDGRFEGLVSTIPHGLSERVQGTFVGPELRSAQLFESSFPTPVDGRWALYTNTSMFLDEFERVGGFDEHMEGYGFEDMDFGLRSQSAGMTCLYAKVASGLHVWHPKEDSELVELENQANLAYILAKHGWDDYFAKQADWSLWWHFTARSGASVVRDKEELWAINTRGTHRLSLPDAIWLDRLGFVPQQVVDAPTPTLSSTRYSGIAELNTLDQRRMTPSLR